MIEHDDSIGSGRFRIRVSRLADSILEEYDHMEELHEQPAGPAPFPTRDELPEGITLIASEQELIKEVIRELQEE